MRIKRLLPWVTAALVATALAVVATGYGGGTTPAGHAKAKKSISIGLVTDTGGLNDRSFNHLAFVGVQRAKTSLGATYRVLTSASSADYIPNLSSLAGHYDLVIGVGFLMADAMDQVAVKFPNQKFAIIDVDQTSLKDKPSNVQGLLFKEQEAGYLVGYLAGLETIRHPVGGKHVIGSVGGIKIPPVDHYIAGYRAGAAAADPKLKAASHELNGYSNDFNNQPKCKELALNEIANGAGVIFQVAGGCGLGALDAAKEKKVWGIGVDADQAYLGPYILTSALKKVDVAVFLTAKAVSNGAFKGGTNATFTVRNGGIGIGKISSKVPKAEVTKVMAVQKKIATGKIKNIPNTVK